MANRATKGFVFGQEAKPELIYTTLGLIRGAPQGHSKSSAPEHLATPQQVFLISAI